MVKFQNFKGSKVPNNGTFVFQDFGYGLYNLDTPRALEAQLSSLALIGGRNIISEKGSLVPQYGYEILGQLPEGEFVATVTRDNVMADSSFFIICQSTDTEHPGNVYLYTAAQGLKKYKTVLEQVYDPVATHFGKQAIIYNAGELYSFGGFYDEGEIEEINENVTLSDFSTYYQFNVPAEDVQYYWNGKELWVVDPDVQASDEVADDHFTVISVTVDPDTGNGTVKAITNGNHKTYNSAVTIAERAIITLDAVYTPEDYDEDDPNSPQPIEIVPALLEVCVNRLFVVDVSGRIYYSQVGVVNQEPFQESYGAGYFEGFYNSTAKTLSIEDYMDGVLISKEDGLYYLTLSSPNYTTAQVGPDSQGMLSIGSMEVNIKRMAQIGQEYATDHIIIRESVYAYDTWSGNLVEAITTNMFSSLVTGQTIIDARILASQALGINSTKRVLAYNAQENIFILYYGNNLNYGIVLTPVKTLFPRQLDLNMMNYLEFNQGIVGITEDGTIIQEYKLGTIVKELTAIAEFEPIGLRDNRFTVSSLLEVTELNAVNYQVSTKNAGSSFQKIQPVINTGLNDVMLPPLIYSDKRFNITNDSFELTTRWADKKANVTRIYAPMSGREGVQISIEFDKNVAFCLAALRLPDFSQGE